MVAQSHLTGVCHLPVDADAVGVRSESSDGISPWMALGFFLSAPSGLLSAAGEEAPV